MKTKYKIIFIVLLSMVIISAVFLPCLAFASSFADYSTSDPDTINNLPYPYTNALCVYNLPSISLVYYRTDTGIRANSLPISLSFTVIQDDEDGDGYFDKLTPHILVGGGDYAETPNALSLLLNISDYDFPSTMSASYYICVSNNIPAYYAATNSNDFVPRSNAGEFLYSYILPTINPTNALTFNAFSIKNELVSANMTNYSTAETDGQETFSTGFVKGLTTIELYNVQDKAVNPTTYNKWQFAFFSGVVPTYYDNTEKVYYLDDSEKIAFDSYNNGYNAGYTEGYDTGEFKGYYEGKLNGREEGYQEGYDEGYQVGVELGDSSLAKPMQVFKSLFRWLGSLFTIELIPGISIGLLILIPVFFAVVLFIIHMVRG